MLKGKSAYFSICVTSAAGSVTEVNAIASCSGLVRCVRLERAISDLLILQGTAQDYAHDQKYWDSPFLEALSKS